MSVTRVTFVQASRATEVVPVIAVMTLSLTTLGSPVAMRKRPLRWMLCQTRVAVNRLHCCLHRNTRRRRRCLPLPNTLPSRRRNHHPLSNSLPSRRRNHHPYRLIYHLYPRCHP